MPKYPMSVSMSMPMNTRGEGLYVNLRVEERDSGTVLADIILTPEQLVKLLHGSSEWVDGFASTKLDRVGKILRTEQVRVPREVTGYGSQADNKALAEAWLAEQTDLVYDEYDVRSTNAGWKVLLRRWIVAGSEPVDDAECIAAGYHLLSTWHAERECSQKEKD